MIFTLISVRIAGVCQSRNFGSRGGHLNYSCQELGKDFIAVMIRYLVFRLISPLLGSKISMASIRSADAATALKDEKLQQTNNNNISNNNNNSSGAVGLGNSGGGPSKFIESVGTENGTKKD